MSYSHGEKWSDEKIIATLKELVEKYNLKTMPSQSQLNEYFGNTKLTNATYDALKAFQLNTINSDTSDLANSKLRDIEASVNTFFNSISTNFNIKTFING